jgi:hypothetical protein
LYGLWVTDYDGTGGIRLHVSLRHAQKVLHFDLQDLFAEPLPLLWGTFMQGGEIGPDRLTSRGVWPVDLADDPKDGLLEQPGFVLFAM